MASVLSNQASLLRDQTESLIVVDVSLRHPANSSNLSSKNDHLYRIMTVMDSISKSRPTLKSDVVEKLTSVEPDRNVVDFLLTNLIRTSDGVYGFSNLGLEDLIQAWPRLKTDWALQRTARFKPWTGRSFFVKGEHSNYIDASMGDYKDISDFFPNAQIDTVSKSGHWPHFDNPVEFLGLIERILRQ
jgi:esterase